MLNPANALTISRLVLGPLFIAFFLTEQRWAAFAALGLAIGFEITDLLDGYVARHFGHVSSLGKLLDPLADSIARFSVFLAFTTEATVRMHPWPVLLVVLIFYRDALVAYVRTFAASAGVVLAARRSGKLKAAVQGVGIITFLSLRAAAFLWGSLAGYRPVVFYAVMMPIVLVTAWSAFDYISSNWQSIVALSQRRAERQP